MDFDSFLNFPSPDMNDLVDWSHPSDAQPDDWDPICAEADQCEPLDSIMTRAKHASYSPTLRLCDIASALKGFSMATTVRVAAPVRMNSDSPELVGSKRPQCLKTVRREKHFRDSGDYEDVKPFEYPAPTFQKRALYVSEQCCSADKRAKLSPTYPSYPLGAAVCNDRQMKFSSKALSQRETVLHSGQQGISQREVHIHSERQRRRSMRDYFTTLQSLIPRIKLKHADRITVLTEVISYIQSLRCTLEELDRKKSGILDLLGLSSEQAADEVDAISFIHRLKGYAGGSSDDASFSVDVHVRLSGSDVLITLNTPKRKGMWSTVLLLLQRYRVEVVNASLETSGESNFHCIRGKVVNAAEFESKDLQDKLEESIVKEIRKRPRRI